MTMVVLWAVGGALISLSFVLSNVVVAATALAVGLVILASAAVATRSACDMTLGSDLP